MSRIAPSTAFSSIPVDDLGQGDRINLGVASILERSAVRYADLFATDHLAIDDTVYDDLRKHFTEDELVELGVHCAYAVGMGRLAATWSVTDDVPDAFRSASDSPLAPWDSDGVVASG
jgi:alkylhydroperoxidase family enzyme